ncbi:MAG: FtsX-like permease family protein [Prolixibacteraceae bacterium]|jgi:putative ABC transport system permease protein|nr:FtsX-like permease family protein [Prolixibacteraceae bacterium]MBT6997992.1 FtsX-like permease family protein [Prolixibacteraceae bacterium]MBT7395998.1 FtsX-like permease family protein [Prolixibacteraceae bacterium]
MFKHFIKISLRNILKNKVNTTLNVASLALGITILLLIASYSLNELSVDKFHSKEERIYKISYGNSSLTPGPLNSFLKNQFPEIEHTTHIETRQLNMFSPVVQFDNNSFEIEGYYSADPGFFEIFDFEVVQGNIQTAIQSPFSLILTESESARIFKLANPIGESVTWKGRQDFTFTVRAIVKDLPSSSSIQFNGLVSDASVNGMGGSLYSEDWGYTVYESYLLLKPNVDEEVLTEKLRSNLIAHYASNLSNKASANDAELNPLSLHRLKSVYFDKSLINDTTNRGNLMLVNILLVIGGIIMLLSLINYVNLTTASTANRTKEIGVQKLIGSSRRALIFQYLSETTIVSLFAVVIGALISFVFIEQYGDFMNVSNGLKFQPWVFLLLIPFILFLGFVAGIYPALLLSSKKAIDIIKMKADNKKGGGSLRRSLIIFQFSVTIVLIAATFLIFKQVNYIKDKDLGIPDEQVVYAKLPFQILAGKKEILRERLQTIPEIEEIAFSSNMFGGIEGLNSQEIDGKTLNFATTWVDAEFIDLYNLQLVDGRFFSKDLKTDVNTTALINEAAVREFGVENPFELNIRIPGGKAKVVGIVKDFNYKSLHNRIEPLTIIYLPRQGQYANLKIAGNNFSETLGKIDNVWNELAPGFPFSYYFLDQSFEKLYKKDEQMAKAVSLFSLIAIAIAVLGILGLSMFLAESRTKQIGVRKVNGARISEILIMLNKDFVKWVAIAFVVASPIAYYIMNKWLGNFAYKTSLSWWIFALAGVLALGIALLTVSWQSWRAATKNPVEALRYE